jgi:hypothetical protein
MLNFHFEFFCSVFVDAKRLNKVARSIWVDDAQVFLISLAVHRFSRKSNALAAKGQRITPRAIGSRTNACMKRTLGGGGLALLSFALRTGLSRRGDRGGPFGRRLESEKNYNVSDLGGAQLPVSGARMSKCYRNGSHGQEACESLRKRVRAPRALRKSAEYLPRMR